MNWLSGPGVTFKRAAFNIKREGSKGPGCRAYFRLKANSSHKMPFGCFLLCANSEKKEARSVVKKRRGEVVRRESSSLLDIVCIREGV